MHSTTNSGVILVEEDAHALIVAPVLAASVADKVATVLSGLTGSAFRVPLVKDDPSAAWVSEGEEIPLSDAQFGEVDAPYCKVAGLTVVTAELAADANPESQAEIGRGIARDIVRKVDAAFFGALPSPAPSGLEALAGDVITIAAPQVIENTDPFIEAMMSAEAEGSNIAHFVAHPTDALALAKIKRAAGSNEPLLGAGAAEGVSRTVAGVPLLTSPAVKPGVIWGLPRESAYLAVRSDVAVESDRSVYFTSDRVAVRARMRVAMAFPHPKSIARITTLPVTP